VPELAVQVLSVVVLSLVRGLVVLSIVNADVYFSNFLLLVLWSVVTAVFFVVLELLVCSFPRCLIGS